MQCENVRNRKVGGISERGLKNIFLRKGWFV